MNIFKFFLPSSVKKNVIIKKYEKLSYEQSIIAAARELKNIDTAQSIVKLSYRNFIPVNPSNRRVPLQHKGLTA